MKSTDHLDPLTPQIPGYKITQEIYGGSRTLVYRGIRQEDDLPVIIKLLKREHPTIGELIQFRNQYTIAKNLNIPGIIKPYSLEPFGNSYALIMEDMGGISVQEFSQGQPLTLDLFLTIAIQVSTILNQLHQQGIIHKDLKPANILIHPKTHEIKLIDFALSTLLPRETQQSQSPNTLEGTLAYLSPEQTGRMNRGIDYRSDFYSLGVTFFQLLTGQLPFETDDSIELVYSHIAKHPPTVNQIRPETPPVLSQIVAKLLAKNAEERYQSALGLKNDLERCWQQLQNTGKINSFKLGENDRSDRFLIPEKLYGREIEITTLLTAFERVAQGGSELILVAGFSGIGKTAVIDEVHKPIVRQRGYFIQGKFDQFQRNTPFSALLKAFRDLMVQLQGESDRQLETWKEKILKQLGSNGQVILEVIPELAQIIGPQPPVQELAGSVAQNRFNLLFSKFIQVFTTPEHPLVIFLDDLQWADSASLNLLKLLMNNTKTGYLLIIGAYRNNEVYATHPLLLALGEIAQKTPITTITLSPLTEREIGHLIADTLSSSPQVVIPLTKLVYRKTNGNPFFTTQFLKALYNSQAIAFSHPKNTWEWDLMQVQALALNEDVVEFMALQLQKLPQDSQEILKLAACIGNQFDLNTLAIVSEKTIEATAISLWWGLQEGLIVPINQLYKLFQGEDLSFNLITTENKNVNGFYKFLHDRIQQAAYLLIPEDQKQATHLRIGRLLLAHIPPEQQEENLFEIVNQFNQGRALIEHPQEREQLAQLNLLAGRKAKSATAYSAACEYVAIGLELLGPEPWLEQYDLTFALHQERCEVEYLNGDFTAAQTWIKRTLDRVKNPLEKAAIYYLEIVQHTLRANYPQAIAAGRDALALFDIDLPATDFEIVRDQEIAIAQAFLAGKTISSLVDLPPMTDPAKKMVTKILIGMGPPTYRSHQRLWSVICAKAVNLCLAFGNTPEAGYIYPAFGGLRGYALDNYQGTADLIDLTLQVMGQFDNRSADSVAYLMIGSSLRHWCHPLKQATKDYQTSYQIGLESSNLQYAAYAFGHNMYCRFYQGLPLEQLESEISEYLEFSHKQKNQWAIDLLTGGQILIAELRGNTTTLTEAEYLEECRAHKNWQVICIYQILKAFILYLEDQHSEALNYAQEAEAQIVNVAPQGLLPYPQHRFIYTLLLLELQEVETIPDQALLAVWANNSPANFNAYFQWVQAEIAWKSGDKLTAIENYDRAIATAREQKFLHLNALINERAAKFYLDWGKSKIAQTYLLEAYYSYARWGAQTKVKNLEGRYPQLLTLTRGTRAVSLTDNGAPLKSLTLTGAASETTNSNVPVLFDLAAILKASQAIAKEIEIEQLLATLLRVLIASAGADKCALVLAEDGNFTVRAIADADHSLLLSQPLENSQDIPLTVVNTVKRTLQPTVIANACEHLQLSQDSYIEKHQSQSILCSPILYQGQLLGILYLENHLTAGVFTSDRLEIINMLCAQAAISLENARLYQQAQTALFDLQQTQLQLIQSEKMSVLGNLVAGVAHEINNPLGFLAGNIQPALDYVSDLFGLIDLYQKSFPEPGSEIEEEIEAIELDYLRSDLPKLIGSMQEGIDRIRNISTSLRNFSRADSSQPVPTHIHEGIDSTLLILKHRLKANDKRPAIEVIKSYDDLPPVLGYPGQLNQVFMNIIANGIDALEEANLEHTFDQIEANPNRLTIRTRLADDGQNVKIYFQDNGVGIPEALKNRIFEHLFTTKEIGKGTGLGLAIARQIIVEKHQGSIEVSSTLGEGSEFIISLPLRPETIAPVPAPSTALNLTKKS